MKTTSTFSSTNFSTFILLNADARYNVWTACTRSDIPLCRSPNRDWRKVFNYFCECLLSILYAYFVFRRLCMPTLQVENEQMTKAQYAIGIAAVGSLPSEARLHEDDAVDVRRTVQRGCIRRWAVARPDLLRPAPLLDEHVR